MSLEEVFDVIIVGSGAARGMAAYDLCKARARVAVLEAVVTMIQVPYEP